MLSNFKWTTPFIFMLSLMLAPNLVIAQNFEAIINVKSHGASGSGETLDTEAIQKAIDACHAQGGGTVYFPNGTYLSGTLVLKSNVTLHLEAGATLLGSANLADYKPYALRPDWEAQLLGMSNQDTGNLHLIYAQRASHIGITGKGRIDGNGRAFWDENFLPRPRPAQMIEFEACEDVVIENVTLQNSPFWALHVLSSNRVRIDGIKILNYRKGPNTDGIDVNSSSNVQITNAFIDTGDDAICFKSHFPNEPVQNVTVSNCILISDDSAIKFGTRSHGDMKFITIANCIIRNSTYGIAFFMKDGGHYNNIRISDVVLENAQWSENQRTVYPIFMDIEKRTPASALGKISRVSLRNLTITTGGHCLIAGMREQPIEDIALENIRMVVPSCDEVQGKSKPRGVRNLAAPPPGTDFAGVPAHWTFAHINGLTIKNLQIEVEHESAEQQRHAIWGAHVQAVTITEFAGRAAGLNGELATIHLDQSRNVFLNACRAEAGTHVFLHLTGRDTENVAVMNSDLAAAQNAFVIDRQVRKKTFYQASNRLK
ncbi:MAG: glycoside hydrolase family 28 protein [candidate division KSB1 bacterium]|nr:glycoside hydrolase family 28 protein [candidate division KSB1 bacterium]